MKYAAMSTPSARKFLLKRQPVDARDHVLASSLATAAVPLASIDLTPQMPDPLDQENIGSCAANACSNALRFCLRRAKLPEFQPSRLFIYWFTRQQMGVPPGEDSGSDMRAVCDAVRKFHACDESVWPYDPQPSQRFSLQPSAAAVQAATPHAALRYQSVSPTLPGICAALHEGHPIMTGISVFPSFESAAVARTGVVPMPGASEQPLGGHAVLMCGINVEAKTFTFLNSWGKDWGNHGTFTLPFAYVLNSSLCFDLWTFRTFA
jgi:C1A family cysteine protease